MGVVVGSTRSNILSLILGQRNRVDAPHGMGKRRRRVSKPIVEDLILSKLKEAILVSGGVGRWEKGLEAGPRNKTRSDGIPI